EVRRLPGDAALEFRLQLVGAVHSKIRIVNDQTVIRGECNGPVDGFKSFAKQRVVVVDASPPLTVVAVGDVELRARVAVSRIGALERHACLIERVASEESEAIGHGLGVDVVGTYGGGDAAS